MAVTYVTYKFVHVRTVEDAHLVYILPKDPDENWVRYLEKFFARNGTL